MNKKGFTIGTFLILGVMLFGGVLVYKGLNPDFLYVVSDLYGTTWDAALPAQFYFEVTSSYASWVVNPAVSYDQNVVTVYIRGKYSTSDGATTCSALITSGTNFYSSATCTCDYYGYQSWNDLTVFKCTERSYPTSSAISVCQTAKDAGSIGCSTYHQFKLTVTPEPVITCDNTVLSCCTAVDCPSSCVNVNGGTSQPKIYWIPSGSCPTMGGACIYQPKTLDLYRCGDLQSSTCGSEGQSVCPYTCNPNGGWCGSCDYGLQICPGNICREECYATCGNGICESGESCDSCSSDCGVCTGLLSVTTTPLYATLWVDINGVMTNKGVTPCSIILNAGSYLVDITKSGYYTQSGTVTITNGGNTQVNYNLVAVPNPPICGNGICELNEETTCPEDCDVPPVCGNGICESGETAISCPADCTAPPVCGNNICESGETATSCPIDCGSVCGNSICESGETCDNCLVDCGECPAICGNGICESTETYATCSQDCPEDCTDDCYPGEIKCDNENRLAYCDENDEDSCWDWSYEDCDWKCEDKMCVTCLEEWACTEWSECLPSNLQTRECLESNECGTTENKPSESKSCVYQICEPFEMECINLVSHQTCNKEGTDWLDAESCNPATEVCEFDGIIATCVTKGECISGDKTCMSSSTYKVCESNEWTIASCKDTEACVNGECVFNWAITTSMMLIIGLVLIISSMGAYVYTKSR